MKLYVEADKVMAGTIEPDYLEDRDDLASVLENKFYEWTGVLFEINPDEMDHYSVKNWVYTEPGWFRICAVYNDLTDEMIERYFDDSVPFLNLLSSEDNIYFNRYSDIEVGNSDDIKQWHDGFTLDYTEIDNEYENLGYGFSDFQNEENIVGQKIIDILYSHKDEISEIMLEYVVPQDELEEYY